MPTEATFTPPRPHCPDPGRWHAPDVDSTETEVSALVAAFVTALRPDFVVETGTNLGYTAHAIGQALAAAGHGQLLTLEVDPDFVAAARERCAGLPVEVVHGSSLDWTPDRPVDFVWFDSLVHIRAGEYVRYLPSMHERTVVGFHDTGPQHPVAATLEALVAEGLMAPPLYLPTPRGVCFTRPAGGPF